MDPQFNHLSQVVTTLMSWTHSISCASAAKDFIVSSVNQQYHQFIGQFQTKMGTIISILSKMSELSNSIGTITIETMHMFALIVPKTT